MSNEHCGENTMSGPSDEPLQGPETRTCPFARPLPESRRLVTSWREGIWENKLNLSFWLILIVYTNKIFSKERSNWKCMSRILYPISTRTIIGWRNVGGICVKWRNCLKKERRDRRSLATNCSLVKYITLLGWSVEDRASSSIRWIGILSGMWKRAQNSRSDRRLTGCSDLRLLAQVSFQPLFWGLPLPLVEATPYFA